ncbi:MAG: DUF3006 domain-containing protein [Anaerovibrio sp.]|uniref:DUF3006 domain-containing protein n=1 Tax=Anaerovibrio sp. TaxID=1872532 RepID=UPI0025CF536D|nr:DUF3006 domain-containing protein [Anaerovibrio sp.]MCR5175544.1 DUF3006 domain-containing protein [Anaerovibrio sp.]
MISGYIDRIEEGLAVILLGEEEHQVEIPCSMLPESLNEGIYVKLDISFDEEKTKAALEEAKALMED